MAEITLRPQLEQLSRLFELARRERLPDRAVLVLEEAVTNVMRHSGCSSLKVSLERRQGALNITVADNGSPFDPTSHAPAPQAEALPAPGGQGIRLMKACSSQMAYTRRQGLNILKITINPI